MQKEEKSREQIHQGLLLQKANKPASVCLVPKAYKIKSFVLLFCFVFFNVGGGLFLP